MLYTETAIHRIGSQPVTNSLTTVHELGIGSPRIIKKPLTKSAVAHE